MKIQPEELSCSMQMDTQTDGQTWRSSQLFFTILQLHLKMATSWYHSNITG